jgi:hypothetical protein
MNEFDAYLVEAVHLEEDDQGKKHRVGKAVYEVHSSTSYANTAANRLHFGRDDHPEDEKYELTNVYGIKRLRWVGKDNGYYA